MRKLVYALVSFGSLGVAQPVFAQDAGTFAAPEPVETFTVCQEPAHYAYNNRARRIRSGHRSLEVGANVATLTRTPDLFFRETHMIQHSYTYLSRDNRC